MPERSVPNTTTYRSEKYDTCSEKHDSYLKKSIHKDQDSVKNTTVFRKKRYSRSENNDNQSLNIL